MAFGRTDPDDPGSYQQKPPKKTDIEPREPPALPDPPAAAPGQPVKPPPEINLDYVAQLARQVLPKDEAFVEVKDWSREQLPARSLESLQGRISIFPI